MNKKIVFFISLVTSLVFVSPAFAHVVVKPDTVGVAAFQTFTVDVPNEKDIPVTALKLIIPEGLKSVSPNVKPGWTIDVKKTGDGEDAKVNEINWTGGTIPAGQRDDFYFSAQVPATGTTINWKAYQTYADGTVVTWDQKPDSHMSDDMREKMEKKNMGPYSQTKIVNDLADNTSQATNIDTKQTSQTRYLSILAVALSAVALVLSLRKK